MRGSLILYLTYCPQWEKQGAHICFHDYNEWCSRSLIFVKMSLNKTPDLDVPTFSGGWLQNLNFVAWIHYSNYMNWIMWQTIGPSPEISYKSCKRVGRPENTQISRDSGILFGTTETLIWLGFGSTSWTAQIWCLNFFILLYFCQADLPTRSLIQRPLETPDRFHWLKQSLEQAIRGVFPISHSKIMKMR